MPTTTELTEKYISEHRSIKGCLKKGLINYSALSRIIARDLDIEKTSSKEAILIAARRFREKIKSKAEDEAMKLFKNSNTEIKNSIVVFTLEKNIYPDSLIEIEKQIKKKNELFFSIEGTKTITIIIQKQNKSMVKERFKNNIIGKKESLSLITITSKGIGKTPGAVSYISGQFYENEVNIEEFMSCHDDTLIVINSKDIGKIMRFLNF